MNEHEVREVKERDKASLGIKGVREGDILEGAFWPELIVVVAVKEIGDLVQIESRGVSSRHAYSNFLKQEELGQKVNITRPTGAGFSGDPTKFRLSIEALRIRLAYEFDPHFAVSVSQIDPLPHQLEAVYHYMLPRARIRFLLADDPGAGKTIMAGLLLKELKLRGLVERVLSERADLQRVMKFTKSFEDAFSRIWEILKSTQQLLMRISTIIENTETPSPKL